MSTRNRTKGVNGAVPSIFPESDEEEDQNNLWKNTNNGVGGAGGGFQINKNYAERYDSWRNKEQLMKMKARFGTSNLDDMSESEESSEEEWTEDKEKAFFKTLSNLKKKDPKIYDSSVFFFNKDQEQQKPSTSTSSSSSPTKKDSKKKNNNKPFLLKDHERTMILEKGALISDSEDEDAEEKKEDTSLSYHQELNSIRKGFKDAMNKIDSDEEEGGEDILLKKGKSKTEAEKKQDDVDYRMWLKGELERLEKGKLPKEEEKELSFLRSYWNDDKLDEGEKFLRDYILNRKYKDEDHEEVEKDHVPSYNAIVHDSDEDLSNDEEFEQKREEFEHKYNFRFEEPDPEFVKRFPRTIEDSLRREDERRKKQRETAKERKKDEKERQKEEVQRLKAYKRKEIMEKLQQLQEISGNADLPLEDLDIEGDFDPDEYDKKMGKVFNDEYYKDDMDGEKPEFPHDPEIDDGEFWVPDDEDDEDEASKSQATSCKKSKKSKKKKHTEDVESVNDNDEEIKVKPKLNLAQELIENSRKKKGKKAEFPEVLERIKPKFNPEVHQTFDQYLQEYYALDFEDVIGGDLKCRFKYRKVAPNDFGLSTEEILKAEDSELNQWASLKKTYQYRADEEEKYEAQAYKKKAENVKLKKQVLPSIYNSEPSNDNEETEETTVQNTTESQADETSSKKKKKKKNKNKKKSNKEIVDSTTEIIEDPTIVSEIKDESQVAETIIKSSKKTNTKKKSAETEEAPVATPKPQEDSVNEKKKKNKNKNFKNTNANGNQGRKRKADTELEVNDDRIIAFGMNPKKYKKWKKYGGKAQQQ